MAGALTGSRFLTHIVRCQSIVTRKINHLCSIPASKKLISSLKSIHGCDLNKKYVDVGIFVRPTFNISYVQNRGYAKGQGKGGKGAKGSHAVMKLSTVEFDTVINSGELRSTYQSVIDQLQDEFADKLTLRTSLGTFNKLLISTTDGSLPLIELGHVTQKGQQSVVIDLGMNSQYISAVKTALTESMGLNPQQDGSTLFVNIPKVTKEHRETLAKTAKNLSNTTKTKLRDVQNKALQKVNRIKKEHSEDLIFGVQNSIQDMTKEYDDKIDKLLANKTKELLGGK